MWMMGYNDEGDLYMADSFNGCKFRPLIPRTISAAPPNCGGNGPGVTLPPCLGHLHHGADVFSLNPNHIGMMSEQSKRELNPQHQVVVSSRWNPTPEQLRTLEELYRRGTRTPSAEQIQHITAQLRRYGKIEGKNVFYWFQNHKARERQKRRRQMESDSHQNINGSGHCGIEILGWKETGAEGACNKTLLGVDHHHHHHHQTNKDAHNSNIWAHPMNCSTLPEEPATSTVQKMAKPRGGGMECKSSPFKHHQWMKIDENGDSQTRRNVNETWQTPTQLINTPTMDPKLINNNNKTLSDHHLTGFFIAHPPPPPPPHYTIRTHEEAFISSHILNISDEDEEEEDDNYESSQTLQLFPLRSGDSYANEKEAETSFSVINSSIAHPYQFFEFLPLKN